MKKKKNKLENNQDQSQTEDIKEPRIKGWSDLWKFLKTNKLLLVLICLFTLLIYANIITGDFVNLDDLSKSFSLPQFQSVSAALKTRDGYTILSAITYTTFGGKSSVFHVLSILTHMINGVLVFTLLYLLFGKKVAVIATFLFLAHPTNTEAISWHAGQIYSLRANVILPILIFFTLFKTTKKKIFLVVSTVAYILGLIFFGGGGWVLVAPFLLVLMDQFIIEKKIKIKNIVEYLPFLIPSLVFTFFLIPTFFKGRVESLNTLYYVDTETATPLINRIPYTIYMEYKTLTYPMTLSIYHEGKYIKPIEYAFMILVTIAVIFGIIYFLKKDRRVSGLMLMILFAILPSFSPVIIAWIAAERYLYIPSIFSSTIFALFIVWIGGKIQEKKSKGKNYKISGEKTNFVLYASITLILLYSIRTVFRNNDLRNSKNLWIATRKTAPYSYRVYNNMGDVLANEGDYEGALDNFKKSVALKPDYADAVHNIGHIYMMQKDYERAKRYLQQSLDMNPRLFPSAYKLGLIYYEEMNFEKSIEFFKKCLEAEPTSIDCANGLATVNQVITKINSQIQK